MELAAFFQLGPLDLLIIAAGGVMLLIHVFFIMTPHWRDLLENQQAQERLASLLPLFPMLGILGTVLGLMKTLTFIAEKGVEDLSSVMGHFATALSTTFWGVFWAIVLTLVNMVLEHRVGSGESS
jgi:hypothetical protein